MLIIENAWVGVLINLPVIIWLLHLYLSTYYVIRDNTLTIVCGVFYKQGILINEITKVRSTNNPLSSPALSMDRLEIQFTGKKTVMISPKDKRGFIEHLLSLNPSIEVRLK